MQAKSDPGKRRSLAALAALIAAGAFICFGSAGCRRTGPQGEGSRASPDASAVKPPQSAPQEAAGGKLAQEAVSGKALYAQHCAACHGEQGDGLGVAATFLFPRPRDFRAGKFRLVSTSNNVPSREDLDAVLLRGMPGSSMPPWAHLTQAQRDALVAEVMRLRGEGARERYIASLKEEEGLSDEEIASDEVQQQIQEYVERFTIPGESSVVPQIPAATDEAIARGKEVYATFACIQCHGADGKGHVEQKMFDDEGLPTKPRDFTAGIFKGGHDPATLYRRIAYGMPGTPMPSSPQMTPEQIASLVHFVRSLSTDEQRAAAVLRRERITAVRAKDATLAPDAPAWDAVPAVAVKTMPLWWRDDADIDLQVQAVHDGRSLAVRLSWRDATQSDSAVRPDQFEDMAAVQLAAAGNEPFLGMGSAEALVELWQWRGGVRSSAEDELMDDYPFDAPVYHELAGGRPLPDFITAREAGNPLAVRDHGRSSLAAKGPGSLTFRPPAAQHVATSGAWKDGRWFVVLRRPLDVKPEEGLSLAPAKNYVAAFAVWDGAHLDRAGQKLVSIWNDLKLE